MNISPTVATPLLELDLLKTLVAISETGNFSAAADVVFRTPSAISMQVKRIEELLGRPIFKRDSRSVSLTEDGEMLLVHARRLLALNQQMVTKFIRPEIQGIVRLGAIDHATEQFLPSALRRFAESHPGITVDVIVENSKIQLGLFKKGELDIAIITCEEAEIEDLNAEVLFREKLVWAGLKGGVAAEQTPLPVSVWEECCVWRKAALAGLQMQNRDYRITFKCAHIAGQKAGILADLAIAPLPASSCEGRIVAIDESFGLPEMADYSLTMLVAKNAGAPVKAVANHFRAIFADL